MRRHIITQCNHLISQHGSGCMRESRFFVLLFSSKVLLLQHYFHHDKIHSPNLALALEIYKRAFSWRIQFRSVMNAKSHKFAQYTAFKTLDIKRKRQPKQDSSVAQTAPYSAYHSSNQLADIKTHLLKGP
jgi:hypothetical protein